MATISGNEAESDLVIHSKPAFIRRVKIRGYKSIAECDVTLEPLTIFVGRNAAGKSNFIDALAFYRDLYEMTATNAVRKHGGWENVLCKSFSQDFVEIEIELAFLFQDTWWNAIHHVALEKGEQNQIRIKEENLQLKKDDCLIDFGFNCSENKEIHWKNKFVFGERNILQYADKVEPLRAPQMSSRRRYDRIILGSIATEPIVDLVERIKASWVYDFSPSEMREQHVVTSSLNLESDGNNLARAIDAIGKEDLKTLERITQHLKAIVPSIESFRVKQYGDYETVRFEVRRTESTETIGFDAVSMSDGTLRVLAALVAVFQRVQPDGGFPGFIAIEEPETALHPAAMHALVAALDEATLRTQILLTTHSPDLLDAPELKPANVRVVQLAEGLTKIGPIDEAGVEIVEQALNSLGGLEREDQLSADILDPIR